MNTRPSASVEIRCRAGLRIAHQLQADERIGILPDIAAVLIDRRRAAVRRGAFPENEMIPREGRRPVEALRGHVARVPDLMLRAREACVLRRGQSGNRERHGGEFETSLMSILLSGE